MRSTRKARQVAVRQAIVLERIIHNMKTNKGDENKDKVKIAQGLRSRAREAPGLILQAGLASLMTHLLSKSKEEEVAQALAALTGKKDVESLGDLESGEAKGYSTMLALLIDALRELNPQNNHFKKLAENYNTLCTLVAIKDLLNNPAEEAKLSRELTPYLVELKKLVEAIVGEQE
ncbi:MAG: type III-B CRISPR module-associated protein Cmr5 [Desulfurococcales archaeon]|nr:type III-B CRISPR module-associated protein Cmr5 [Desulfurococcales archaeon]